EGAVTLNGVNGNVLNNLAGNGTSTSPGHGGGIDNKGTLSISGGSFILNTATFGGGIHNTGALPSVSNCFFESNSATNASLADYGGGINNYRTGTGPVTGLPIFNKPGGHHA